MDRGAKTAKTMASAKRRATRRSRPNAATDDRSVEQRLASALEQQAATSEILRVISASPGNAQPVFETIAANALRLCDARFSTLFTFDGELIHIAAHHNLHPEGAAAFRTAYPSRPSRGGATHRAILTGSIVQIADVLEDSEFAYHDAAKSAEYRSALSVPMLRDRRPIGTITVYRDVARPFPDTHIELLKTFAEQAVIAIENVRLFTESEVRNRDLTEALGQQTATSELLKVIGRSKFDLQLVFQTLAESAVRLCAAERGLLFRFDGQLLRFAVGHNVSSELREFFERNPMAPGRHSNAGRAALERRTVHNHDVLSDPEYSYGGYRVDPYRTVLAIPMLTADELLGVIVIYRHEVRPFTGGQIALMETFADQAAIAIENVRLFKELEARTNELSRSVGELRALGDVGQAVSSTLDLETVLSTIVTRATQLTGMDGGSIYEYDEVRQEFYLHTAHRLPDELVDALRATPIRKGEGALGRLAVTAEPVQIRDIMDEGGYQSRVREILIALGHRSLLAVPLLREDHLLGGLVVNRKRAGEFAADVIALLKTFATQSALAIQNARLFREIEVKSRQLETASKHKSEFLANMSHELRTPLNAIIGFSEVLAERLFGEMNDKQAEYVRDINESGQHLLSLINDILDLSKIEAGRLELDPSEFDVATAIGNTLSLVRERAHRRGIALHCTVDREPATIRADERKVKQVLLNLLSNALKFTPEGGVIEVRATAYDDRTEIAVSDTGVGIAPDDHEAVFEEFRQVGARAKKIEGTGLGLAISRKFIELHGGRIWVTSQVGAGSTFTFTLPRR